MTLPTRIYRGCAAATTLAAALLATLTWAGCSKVQYPHCGQDKDCAQHGQVCIQGQCQECRDDAGCEVHHPGEGRTCQAGRCEAKAECAQDADCRAKGDGNGEVCRRGACVPECAANADCGTGRRCQAGRCQAGCQTDQSCPAGQICSEGICQVGAGAEAAVSISSACRPDDARPGDIVKLPPVHFVFNKFDLTPEVQAQLQQAVNCLKEAPASLQVVVEGHCDDRGTQEYNLALGQRRAQSVVDYMARLGADAARLGARSKGENEPTCTTLDDACFGRNRRVEFIQSQVGQP